MDRGLILKSFVGNSIVGLIWNSLMIKYICICNCDYNADEMPFTKGPTTRAMARRIQEEWALNAHARPKINFTWAKEDVKT